MRKLFMLVSALTLTIGVPFAAPQPANANHGVVGFCEAIIPEFPGSNLGECISFNRVPDDGLASHECDFLLEQDPDAFFEEFESFSDCVQALKGTSEG